MEFINRKEKKRKKTEEQNRKELDRKEEIK